MNIWFERENCKVKACFNTGFKMEKPTVPFIWECQNEVEAEIMKGFFNEKLQDLMLSIRKTAYKKGVADKSAKRKLLQEFSGSAESNNFVGW